ncbi:aspartate aminotransferase family protein [Microbulbifer hydrolyticus]|uniref:Aminotransferase class III-fold pyridoxal phosphate-dependent enzyme n=1 Tax=Microbulbifer hydrolyticus TaxID=48074 RepID=A0A6P1TCA4_9GAMM|nr:aspartate aminotransferase family protein [Microbulbifer hydrolyticus]MBB5213047.1 beta-alanine--pyruvate transaminase [Microbulbifer hydrolyticus]QHQ40408.1 aminotransferase class III-fold pyridoxal phosphate-dependent enzyme [Microbulbifer hydrolyticus]
MSELNTNAFWMPFTPNRTFKAAPRIVERAEGIYLYDKSGRKIIDATAGLWCSNAGHCRSEIADAISEQARKLDYSSIFNFGHELSFEYAERLVQYTPDGLNRVFFGNSGSEAVESALKIALQYQRARGKGTRTMFIGREKGYHGVNFGGISVGGIAPNYQSFGQPVKANHLRHTLDIERNAFTRGLPEHGLELAEDLERLVTFHGADQIAAVIVEPFSGAGGVVLPPKGYLKRIREICDQHDLLLIFDEVISGWGRTGSPFASQEWDVTPDMMTSAKGITNATVPLGAVFVNDKIYNTVMDAAAEGMVEFFHGYTYSAHPVACAAGMATLDIYDREGLLTRASGDIGTHWENALHSLADLDNVIDVRNYGLVGAIELRAPEGLKGRFGGKASALAWDAGVMARGIGDALCMSPPLIVEAHEIDTIVNTLREVISGLA